MKNKTQPGTPGFLQSTGQFDRHTPSPHSSAEIRNLDNLSNLPGNSAKKGRNSLDINRKDSNDRLKTLEVELKIMKKLFVNMD